MIRKYRYNDIIYDTLNEVERININVHIRGHYPLMETQEIENEEGETIEVEVKIGNVIVYVDMTQEHIDDRVKQFKIRSIIYHMDYGLMRTYFDGEDNPEDKEIYEEIDEEEMVKYIQV